MSNRPKLFTTLIFLEIEDRVKKKSMGNAKRKKRAGTTGICCHFCRVLEETGAGAAARDPAGWRLWWPRGQHDSWS
jgi:hypothetical protein